MASGREGTVLWMVAMALAVAGEDLDAFRWQVVNDTVMGGVSSSRVEVGDAVLFSGALSLEQNGGFVSVRSTAPVLDLRDAVGVRVHLKGDGRTYDLTLRRVDVPLRAGSYRVKVQTTGEPQVVEVPLSAFRPTAFGRPVAGAPALDSERGRIDSVGFLLADGQPGAFALEVFEIAAIPGPGGRGPGHDEVLASLQGALARGVPAFNAGDARTCSATYTSALEGASSHAGLTAGERALVAEALAAASGQDDVAAAWTLRAAIDSVLASAR